MPSLMVRRRLANFVCTQSRNKRRDTKNASVAPMLEANDTITVPQSRPKMAPAAKVMIAAPGRDRPVTATYARKKIRAVRHGLAS